MTTKQIIDKHFEQRYKYYLKICWKITGGDKEVYEDLLHESYPLMLAMKESTIRRFHEIEKLHYLGIRTIRVLYSRRHWKKKYSKNASSPLFMAVDNFFRIDKPEDGKSSKSWKSQFNFQGSDDDYISFELEDHLEERKYTEQDYTLLDQAISKLLQDPEKTVGVTIFLQASEISINKLSRDSGISRYYLTNKYNEGLNNLKNHIQNDKNKPGNTSPHTSEPKHLQILDRTKREIAA